MITATHEKSDTLAAQAERYAWDLTKATLTSLALLGLGGCSETPVNEVISARPTVTPAAVMQNSEQWIGKEVTIYGKPELLGDYSSLTFRGGRSRHAYLQLDVQYRLQTENPAEAAPDLKVIQWEEFDVCNEPISLKNPTQKYQLKPETYVVSGTIKKFSDGSGIYLEVDRSMYSAESK